MPEFIVDIKQKLSKISLLILSDSICRRYFLMILNLISLVSESWHQGKLTIFFGTDDEYGVEINYNADEERI